MGIGGHALPVHVKKGSDKTESALRDPLFYATLTAGHFPSRSQEDYAAHELTALRRGNRNISKDPRVNASHWLGLYRDFITSHPGTDAAVFARICSAWRFHQMGNDDAAIQAIDVALTEAKGTMRTKAISEKSDLLQDLGRASESIDLMQSAIAEAPDQPETAYCRLSLAWAYAKVGRADLAQATCQEVLQDKNTPKFLAQKVRLEAILMRRVLFRGAKNIDANGQEAVMSIKEQDEFLQRVREDLAAFKDSARGKLLAATERASVVLQDDGSTEDLADEAAYELGLLDMDCENYDDAVVQFQSVVDSTVAPHDLQCEAEIAIGGVQYRSGMFADCLVSEQNVLADPLIPITVVDDASGWLNLAKDRLGMIAPPPPDSDDPAPPQSMSIRAPRWSVYL